MRAESGYVGMGTQRVKSRNRHLRELQSGAQDDVKPTRSYLATGSGYNLNDPEWSLHRLRETFNRHNTQIGHTEALEAFCHRLRADAAQGAGEVVSLLPRAP